MIRSSKASPVANEAFDEELSYEAPPEALAIALVKPDIDWMQSTGIRTRINK